MFSRRVSDSKRKDAGAAIDNSVSPTVSTQMSDGSAPEGKGMSTAHEGFPELDLVFICDCTGSMGSYITAAQQNIHSIVERVVQSERADVRFALVAYRDHPPQDTTFITQVHPFTLDIDEMKGYVDTMAASGGGDGPEAVTAALDDALNLPWRPSATKIAILIADAPPHGLEPCGDGFPNGDPLGRDPLVIARAMAEKEITCYTVGCEPALGSFRFARDFMCTLAEVTGGQAVALASASLLAEVIVNGSAEEISMTLLQREVEGELENVRALAFAAGDNITEEVLYQRAAQQLHSRNVRSKQMRTDGGKMKNTHSSIWHKSTNQTLSGAKAELCAAECISTIDDDFAGDCSEACWSEGARVAMSRRGLRSERRYGDVGSHRMRASKKKAMGGSVLDAVSSVASVFRRGSGSSPAPEVACARKLSRDASPASACCDELDGSPVSSVEADARMAVKCSLPSGDVMNKNTLAEDLISVDQIARMAKRAEIRKKS